VRETENKIEMNMREMKNREESERGEKGERRESREKNKKREKKQEANERVGEGVGERKKKVKASKQASKRERGRDIHLCCNSETNQNTANPIEKQASNTPLFRAGIDEMHLLIISPSLLGELKEDASNQY
jgi:hypothetical protein